MSFREYIQEKTIVIYDNNGKTFDRYAVIIGDNVFGMSENPNSPQGVNQWVGLKNTDIKIGAHLGKIVTSTSLPKDVQKAIKDRMKEA